MINEEEMKQARREYEIKQAAAKRSAIEKTKSMRDRRLAADERKFLKECGGWSCDIQKLNNYR